MGAKLTESARNRTEATFPMIYDSLSTFLKTGKADLAKGPIGVILLEDEVEAASTVRHHLDRGFKTLIVVGDARIALPDEMASQVARVCHDMMSDDALTDVMNGIIKSAPDVWIYYCYNSEYLFYPFCESRSVGEMVSFCMEERRYSVLSYIVDLYAGDLAAHPNAVSLDNAHLDKSGYYALARKDEKDKFAERQLDFFGGLRWRFEEHVPMPRRRIDRIALFRAKAGLVLHADHTFNDPEYNTYACPWHHSMTIALCSFRTAKALKRNPGSTKQIPTFMWHNSSSFTWHSQQLLDFGLMEPGQWF